MKPLSEKIFLQLQPPAPGDVTADRERLLQALLPLAGEVRLSYTVLKRDYTAFRTANWAVTATLIRTESFWEVAAIEAGDTTENHYGLAVDLGSTTVAMDLIDLRVGAVLGHVTAFNHQIDFGEDILTRIFYTKDHPERRDALQRATTSTLCELMDQLEADTGIALETTALMVIAGNTTMIHFLLALDAFPIFSAPFAPYINESGFLHGAELGIPIKGMVYCIPSIANYLGGDIISGLLATGMPEDERLSLYIDIGTNGEMVIGNRDFLIAGAGAAGPALEGGISRYGMRASEGAVDTVTIRDDTLQITTIGGMPPKGICGSGIVDLLAQMLLGGWMDFAGHLRPDASPLITTIDGEAAVIYAQMPQGETTTPLYFSQSDIAAFLDTKAAAATMVECLLEATGIDAADVEVLYMAGGFGQYLNLESAITIGMYPDLPRERFSQVGNGSLKGACLLMQNRDLLPEMLEMAHRIHYLEFGAFPDFLTRMRAATFFPHTDLNAYPTVMAELRKRGVLPAAAH